MYDVAVIGAGPVGSYIAGKLAAEGFDVALIEEHQEVGHPVQCAGIVSPGTFKITGKRIAVLNSVSGARIHAPDGRMIEIDGGREMATVIDRSAFDRELAAEALRNGTDLLLGTRVRSFEDGAEVVINARKGEENLKIRSRAVVGADGIQSITARHFGMEVKREVFSAFEIETAEVTTPDSMVDIFTGSGVAPGFFAWIVPTGDGGGRVGLASPGSARAHFKNLEKHTEWGKYFNPGMTYHYIAGGIHMAPPGRRTFSNRVIVVGDAAGQVKATSGGGIYMGLRAAVHAVSALKEALEKGDLSATALKVYQDGWKGDIGKELERAYRIHRIYASLSDGELNRIFELLDSERVLKTIEKYGDIDYPSRLVMPLLRAEPAFMRFGGKILRGF